jgi:dTDP-4-amino-4,6-dideoxygalactose transaminase
MIIPFEPEYRRRFHELMEQVFDSNFLSEGPLVRRFEQNFAAFVGLRTEAVAVANGGLALLALLEAAAVAGGEVVVPANTFMATPLAVTRAGAKPVFADCNREDLCLSLSDLKTKITARTKAVVVVHIGGHLAFEIEDLAAYLAAREIPLIEDCAHAHGATLHGQAAGTYGLGGAYSFYATKTLPTGEGGMVVSTRPAITEFVRKWRNYGKPDYLVNGFNARMNETTAALGLVQLERLPLILAWKRNLSRKLDTIFKNRVVFPQGLESGFYKYIVFDSRLKEETGQVYGQPCHEIMGTGDALPNTEWVKKHHSCAPVYYGWDGADLSIDEIATRLLA